ncbi:hypothetical protein H0H92_003090 [Tricholoma furcatifolium]|nr:hypothetical protein H0H92_003090 [Tricholoma furcatifolium]
MLVNVVPAANARLSAVVFSVTFEDLDSQVPIPSTWTAQLNNLRIDELEVPTLIHALDKAAGIIALLEEITFDLSTKVISCHFVDGSVEQWALTEERCVQALERVVRDVNESSLAIEREIAEEKRQRERELERRRNSDAPLPLTSTRQPTRHKKQRSLLMTLVASIIPLYSPSSNSRLPTPPPTPIDEKNASFTISPRDRRRRARSQLVDTFRRYALSELSRRLPRGGYTAWVLQSMLCRATETMNRLVVEAGGVSEPTFPYIPEEPEFFAITAESLPPTPSVSDDESEFMTDTDGSSLHTPVSPLTPTSPCTAFAPHPSHAVRRHSYVSRSPRRLLSENNYAVYAQNAALAGRLRRLIAINENRQEQEAEDIKYNLHLLEIRSRRRAWLNRTLLGGVRSEHIDIEMSTVFQSSSLARHSWTSDDYEYAPDEPEEPEELELFEPIQRRVEYEEYDKTQLKLQRGQRCKMTSRLFPVSEEEDEDTILSAQDLQVDLDGFDIDLEGGVRCNDYDEPVEEAGIPVTFEIEKPRPRPRVRTSSMYKHRLHVPPPPSLEPEYSVPSQLTASSLLCQPFIGCNSSQDLIKPPVYTEVDVNLNVSQVDLTGYGGFDKYSEEEFTLSMDLPISVRSQDRGVLANRRRFSFGSDRGWFSPRLPQPPGLGDLFSRNV